MLIDLHPPTHHPIAYVMSAPPLAYIMSAPRCSLQKKGDRKPPTLPLIMHERRYWEIWVG